MTKQIRAYLEFLEQFFSVDHTNEELLKMRDELLLRISFYKHERFIHLIVMMAFAVFFLLSLIIYYVSHNIAVLVLSALFLILLVPYIKHYYFLENSVQKMYLYYYKVEKL